MCISEDRLAEMVNGEGSSPQPAVLACLIGAVSVGIRSDPCMCIY